MESHLSGAWHNQHGSTMDIVVHPGGKLIGTYRTAVGITEPGEPFPLTGFIADDLVAFVVNFGSKDSLTTWTGHFLRRDGVERLEVLWHMAVHMPHPERTNELWKALWSGSDTFERGEAVARPNGGERMPSHPAAASQGR